MGKFVVNSEDSRKEKIKKDTKKISDGDFEEKSCFFLKRTFFVRKWFIHLVHWPWFERLSILVILVNCVCLALADPLDSKCVKMNCKRLKKFNSFVLYFFVAEMVIKIAAMGVMGRRGYFSEGWNRLDFLIVAAGIVDEFSGFKDGAFLVMIRLVRVLRPLRAINRVPSIRILVTLLLESLPLLGNLLALAFLVLFIFSIVGVQLWQGVLRNRCFVNSTLLNATGATQQSCYYQLSFEEPDFLCSLPSDSGTQRCSGLRTTSHCTLSTHPMNGNSCEFSNIHKTFSKNEYRCLQEGPNPFYATVSFDNIGYAFIVIFQIITLEGWSDIMYRIQETHDYWNWIYFVILILLGPFFLVNLCLVVLAMQFRETKSRELQLLEEDRQKKLKAEKIFKQTKWGKVLTVVKSSLSESLQKRSDQHVHHHHHFHHYYHHEHVVQNPLSPRQDPEADAPGNPAFVFSHLSSISHTPPIIHNRVDPHRHPTVLISNESSVNSPPINARSQEPNDSIISLEMTSNCKISPNCLSPSSFSGRLSPTCSVESASPNPKCYLPDSASLSSGEEFSQTSGFSSVAAAAATVHVNVASCQVHDERSHKRDVTKCAKTEVRATANASAKLRQNSNQDNGTTRVTSPKVVHSHRKPGKTPRGDAANQTVSSIRDKNPRSNTLATFNIQNKRFTESKVTKTVTVAQTTASDSNTSVVLNPQTKPSAEQNSLQNLNVSALKPLELVAKPFELPMLIKRPTLEISSLGGKYRKRSESVEEVGAALQAPGQQRGTDGSLEDRFGSMFDIQRHGMYYVSQEQTHWQRFRGICAKIANNAIFINFIMIVILINTITMATEHFKQPKLLDDILEISNLAFIAVFSLEMIIKIAGEGIQAYMNQWFNIFDGFIVILSITEVIVLRGSGGFSVLRSIRLLRIFRLIRPIRRQLIVMVHTTTSVVTFTTLLFLFMFTFAVLGMNLFGGKLKLPTANCSIKTARTNFDTFPSAMITIFQVLTLEDWNLVMQSAMRSTNHWAAIYFIILTIIGYYVLFNLLVAILVEGFTNPFPFDRSLAEQNDNQLEENQTLPNEKPTTDWLALIKQAKNQHSQPESSPEKELKDDLDNLTDTDLPRTENIAEHTSKTPTFFGSGVREDMTKSRKTMNLRNIAKSSSKSLDFNNICQAEDKVELKNSSKPSASSKLESCEDGELKTSCSFLRQKKGGRDNNGYSCDSPKIPKPQIVITSEDRRMELVERSSTESLERSSDHGSSSKSLFIFSEGNRFRRWMVKITTSKLFDHFVLLLIIVSCGFMVLDVPSIKKEHAELIHTANLIFTILFTIEVIIKVVAQGLVLGKGTYLRVGWNILDFIIVIVSWLHVITSSFNPTSPGILKSAKVLRALRTLRPLRMIRRAPGLKLVVGALLRSLKPIGNTVLIAGIFFVVFGILGVHLFKGQLYYCEGDVNVSTKNDCLERSIGKWKNRPYNFDNLAQALVTLFVLSTRDGWVTVMHHGVDAVGIDSQPRQNYNEWRVLYFISFLMVVGFLVLNMVVGIVVNNYQLCQEKQQNADRTLKSQKIEDLEIIDKTRYDDLGGLDPTSFRGRCFRVCHNKYWDLVIAVIIGVNVMVMSLEHYNMSRGFKIVLEVNNYVCTGIFIIEAFVKLVAVGCKCYFCDRWNILDFLVVIFSIAGIILDSVHDAMKPSVKPTVLRGLRVLRIIRVLKLFKVAKGVRSLLDTVVKSLPQVANLGIVLFLLFFIYSALGIQLFGTIECSARNPCYGIDSHAHFRNFPTAMLTLFRVATGDNWNTIFMDTLRSVCDSSAMCQKNCCFSKYMAPLYFTTFVLATHFVLLNVLVAVLMKDLKASREKLAKVLRHESAGKQVLKIPLSATKSMKEKVLSGRSRTTKGVVDDAADWSGDGHIELKQMRRNLEPD